MQTLSQHNGPVWTMKWSPCGSYLASAGQDAVVRIWVVVGSEAHQKWQRERNQDNEDNEADTKDDAAFSDSNESLNDNVGERERFTIPNLKVSNHIAHRGSIFFSIFRSLVEISWIQHLSEPIVAITLTLLTSPGLKYDCVVSLSICPYSAYVLRCPICSLHSFSLHRWTKLFGYGMFRNSAVYHRSNMLIL